MELGFANDPFYYIGSNFDEIKSKARCYTINNYFITHANMNTEDREKAIDDMYQWCINYTLSFNVFSSAILIYDIYLSSRACSNEQELKLLRASCVTLASTLCKEKVYQLRTNLCNDENLLIRNLNQMEVNIMLALGSENSQHPISFYQISIFLNYIFTPETLKHETCDILQHVIRLVINNFDFYFKYPVEIVAASAVLSALKYNERDAIIPHVRTELSNFLTVSEDSIQQIENILNANFVDYD